MKLQLKDLFKKKSLADYIIYAAILVAGVFIDQLTKWLVVKNMYMFEHIPVIKIGGSNIASLYRTINDGAAFGMMSDAPWVFNTISVIALTAMMAFLFLGHAESMLSGIAVSMMISGGIGNMIDRIRFRYVVDMIYLDMFDFLSFNTIFNAADSFVCIGAALLVLALIIEMKEEIKQEKLAKEASERAAQEESEE